MTELSGRGGGEVNAKCGPFAGAVGVRPDFSAVEFHETFDDEEAQPDGRFSTGRLRADAGEGLEEAFGLMLGKSGSGILYTETDVGLTILFQRFKAGADKGCLWGKFDGIAEKVVEDLLKTWDVSADLGVRGDGYL